MGSDYEQAICSSLAQLTEGESSFKARTYFCDCGKMESGKDDTLFPEQMKNSTFNLKMLKIEQMVIPLAGIFTQPINGFSHLEAFW